MKGQPLPALFDQVALINREMGGTISIIGGSIAIAVMKLTTSGCVDQVLKTRSTGNDCDLWTVGKAPWFKKATVVAGQPLAGMEWNDRKIIQNQDGETIINGFGGYFDVHTQVDSDPCQAGRLIVESVDMGMMFQNPKWFGVCVTNITGLKRLYYFLNREKDQEKIAWLKSLPV